MSYIIIMVLRVGFAFQTRLYWTDWTGHIRSLDKRRAYRLPDEIAVGILKPFSLQIFNGTDLKGRKELVQSC